MNKYIGLLLGALLLLLSAVTFAQSQNEEQQDEYYKAEKVMANTMHQFVYAFFGKELLINYLANDEDVEALKTLTDSELIYLSKPFNTYISKFVLAGLTSIYWITVGYFLVRILAFSAESVWLLQRKGTTPMDQETFKSFSIKMVILSGMAVAPMSIGSGGSNQNISMYTMFLFDLMGKAHQMGDDSLSEMINNQRISLQTARIPHADAKWSTGLALNEFMTCVRLDTKRGIYQDRQALMDFHINSRNEVQGTLSEGNCHLLMTFGYDSATADLIDEMKRNNTDLPITSSVFINAQKEVFTSLASKLFTDASHYSQILSLPHYEKAFYNAEDKSKQNYFSGYTSDSLSEFELNQWENRCDTIRNQGFPNESISKTDRLTYHMISARCLSMEITKSILYPDTFGDVTRFLQNDALKNRHLPICMDEVEFNRTLNETRYMPQFILDLRSDGLSEKKAVNIDQFPLDSCLANMCSESSLRQGGLFGCVNAIDMYKKRQDDLSMEGRGTLMLGFYMFNLYNQQVPTSRSKHIFQSSNATFSTNSFNLGVNEAIPFMQLPVTLPPNSLVERVELEKVTDILRNPFSKIEYSKIEPVSQSEMSEGLLNAIQHQRLLTCARNPLQIADGYVCGNIPQEFSAFGMNILRFTIAAKGLLILGDMARNTGIAPGSNGTISSGDMKSMAKPMLDIMAPIVAAGLGSLIVDSVMDLSFAATDEFGYLDQKAIRSMTYQNSAEIGFLTIAVLANNEIGGAISSIIDSALLFLLLIGILCAFVIPLMPMILVMYALIKFTSKLFITLAMTGISLVDASFEDEPNFLTEKVDKIWSDWLALILQLPLLFIGIILAWLMSNVIIAHVLQKMQVTLVTNDGAMGPIDTLVMLIMVFGIIFVVYNTVMSVIESFYDFTVEWILGQMSNSPFSDRKAMGWKDSKDVLALMGR